MADPKFVVLDTDADPGEQLAPEMVAEIREVAPSAVVNGSITEPKFADEAVSTRAIAPGAVTTAIIATNGVETVNVKAGAITDTKIADGSVTRVKAGLGVVTVVDSSSNPVEREIKEVTAAEYAAIGSPDPNVYYFASA